MPTQFNLHIDGSLSAKRNLVYQPVHTVLLVPTFRILYSSCRRVSRYYFFTRGVLYYSFGNRLILMYTSWPIFSYWKDESNCLSFMVLICLFVRVLIAMFELWIRRLEVIGTFWHIHFISFIFLSSQNMNTDVHFITKHCYVFLVDCGVVYCFTVNVVQVPRNKEIDSDNLINTSIACTVVILSLKHLIYG